MPGIIPAVRTTSGPIFDKISGISSALSKHAAKTDTGSSISYKTLISQYQNAIVHLLSRESHARIINSNLGEDNALTKILWALILCKPAEVKKYKHRRLNEGHRRTMLCLSEAHAAPFLAKESEFRHVDLLVSQAFTDPKVMVISGPGPYTLHYTATEPGKKGSMTFQTVSYSLDSKADSSFAMNLVKADLSKRELDLEMFIKVFRSIVTEKEVKVTYEIINPLQTIFGKTFGFIEKSLSSTDVGALQAGSGKLDGYYHEKEFSTVVDEDKRGTGRFTTKSGNALSKDLLANTLKGVRHIEICLLGLQVDANKPSGDGDAATLASEIFGTAATGPYPQKNYVVTSVKNYEPKSKMVDESNVAAEMSLELLSSNCVDGLLESGTGPLSAHTYRSEVSRVFRQGGDFTDAKNLIRNAQIMIDRLLVEHLLSEDERIYMGDLVLGDESEGERKKVMTVLIMSQMLLNTASLDAAGISDLEIKPGSCRDLLMRYHLSKTIDDYLREWRRRSSNDEKSKNGVIDRILARNRGNDRDDAKTLMAIFTPAAKMDAALVTTMVTAYDIPLLLRAMAAVANLMCTPLKDSTGVLIKIICFRGCTLGINPTNVQGSVASIVLGLEPDQMKDLVTLAIRVAKKCRNHTQLVGLLGAMTIANFKSNNKEILDDWGLSRNTNLEEYANAVLDEDFISPTGGVGLPNSRYQKSIEPSYHVTEIVEKEETSESESEGESITFTDASHPQPVGRFAGQFPPQAQQEPAKDQKLGDKLLQNLF